MMSLSSIVMTRLYFSLFTTLAEQSSEPKDALPYYKRALDAAKDSENKVEIAKAALRLGICYHELLDNELASQVWRVIWGLQYEM